MRYIITILTFVACYFWVSLLDKPIGKYPPLGKFFGPVKGFWNNAMPMDENATSFHLPKEDIRQSVTVTFSDRLVPHVEAQNENDLYYTQGYLHASNRLWQMNMLVRIANGSVSEILGSSAVNYDRLQRRKGMNFAAKNSLKLMEADPNTLAILNAYTDGVNAYIDRLLFKDYPLEYKLLDYKPELWNNLKTVLLMKFLSDQLSSETDDLALSQLRTFMSETELAQLFPDQLEDSFPVIPKSTKYNRSQIPEMIPFGNSFADFSKPQTKIAYQVKEDNFEFNKNKVGSNSWVIGKKISKSGNPILANDPHLQLSVPSLWYELQMSSPTVNSYGVSIPGTPGIIIGFNDSIAWGFTNASRDVLDYYEIEPTKDDRFYKFDGKEIPFNYAIEEIKVRNKPSIIDSVKYTIHGPVMYDAQFPDPLHSGKLLAIRWAAHDPSNEIKAIYQMNRAQNYEEFLYGIVHFKSPAQNIIYADRLGNIAIWSQGKFVNKWRNQGKYVMKGNTVTTLWGKDIPFMDHPHSYNPSQGYLASANQTITDKSYPYWYTGSHFNEMRAYTINNYLSQANLDATCRFDIKDMMKLQNDNYNPVAALIVPKLDSFFENGLFEFRSLSSNVKYNMDANSELPTKFKIFWKLLQQNMWSERLKGATLGILPNEYISIKTIVDNIQEGEDLTKINTIIKQDFKEILNTTYQKTLDSVKVLKNQDLAIWFKFRNTSIRHLAQIDAFSYLRIATNGEGNAINSMRKNVGPSWRMVVELGKEGMEAYGMYPGGQSGNPGSKYYNQNIDNWAKGIYYKINFKPKKIKR